MSVREYAGICYGMIFTKEDKKKILEAYGSFSDITKVINGEEYDISDEMKSAGYLINLDSVWEVDNYIFGSPILYIEFGEPKIFDVNDFKPTEVEEAKEYWDEYFKPILNKDFIPQYIGYGAFC